jgi:hypothetical protein
MEDSLELGLPQGEAPLEAEVEQEQTEQDEQD